jgi:hypothetical protein
MAITLELLRSRAEHNAGVVATLEVSLGLLMRAFHLSPPSVQPSAPRDAHP